GLGIHNFHNTHNVLPPSKMDDTWGTWATLILPYLEGDNAFRLWEPEKRYYIQRPEARMHNVKVYFCPSRRGVSVGFSSGDQRTGGSGIQFPDTPGGLSDFAACVGTHWDQRDGAITDAQQRVIVHPVTGATLTNLSPPPDALLKVWRSRTRFLNIVDGTSNTLMIGEKHIRSTIAPGTREDRSVYNGDHERGPVGREAGRGRNSAGVLLDRPLVAHPGRDMGRDAINEDLNDKLFGGPHPGVCQFVFCDGSVRAIRVSIDLDTLARLAGRADGLPVTGDF
ncbi:MAG TPA: DUF1559 domain-containing protein, partial [Gemmataceae bacterium]|nr:DUF1559 domain-containing protein [Gemmataceae bacterium]